MEKISDLTFRLLLPFGERAVARASMRILERFKVLNVPARVPFYVRQTFGIDQAKLSA